MGRGSHLGETNTVVCARNRPRRDKTPAIFNRKNQDEHAKHKCRKRLHQHSAFRSQRTRWLAFWQSSAASSIRQRTGFTRSSLFRRARAAKASFRLARSGFKRRLAFITGTAFPSRARPESAFLSRPHLAAFPIAVGSFVLAMIEFWRRQLILHCAPPEKAVTSSTCSAAKISSP